MEKKPNPIISLSHISYQYEGSPRPILKDFSLDIFSGEYIALTGANGAGKSTIGKIIARLKSPDSGTLTAPKALLIFQSPRDQIISSKTLRDTLFYFTYCIGKRSKSDKVLDKKKALESLSFLGVESLSTRATMALSLGEVQRVATAGVLLINAPVIIFDEATSSLDKPNRDKILNLMDTLNKDGKTIIHITHDPQEIKRAKRVVEIGERHPPTLIKSIKIEQKEKVISLIGKDISFSYGKKNILSSVNLILKKGELVALTGVSGAGKTTLLEILSRIKAQTKGAVHALTPPLLALQDTSAGIFEAYVSDEVAFAAKNHGLSGDSLVKAVRDALDLVGLPYKDFSGRLCATLSGGEKRRLGIASIIVRPSSVLLFDEPDNALDEDGRLKIITLLKTLSQSHAVLFSTHNSASASVADRTLNLFEGTLVEVRQDSKSPSQDKDYLKDLTEPSLPLLPLLDGAHLIKTLDNINLIDERETVGKGVFFSTLFTFTTLFFATIFIRNLTSLFFTLTLSCAFSLIEGVGLKKLLKSIVYLIPVLLIFFLFQLITPADGDTLFRFWFFNLTIKKIEYCLMTLLKTQSILSIIIGFQKGTTQDDIINFFRFFGRRAAVMAEIIYRFIPLLASEAQSILKTNAIRGSKKGKLKKVFFAITLCVPLINRTLKRAALLGDALTVRGFQ